MDNASWLAEEDLVAELKTANKAKNIETLRHVLCTGFDERK